MEEIGEGMVIDYYQRSEINVVARPGALASCGIVDTRCCRYSVSRGNNKIQKQWAAVVPRYGNSSVHRQTSRFPRQPLWSTRSLDPPLLDHRVPLCKMLRRKWSRYADACLCYFFFFHGKRKNNDSSINLISLTIRLKSWKLCYRTVFHLYLRSGTTLWRGRSRSGNLRR